MTPTEAVKLVAFVTQISPAQKFDEYTADAWHALLDDVAFSDAFEAVKRIGKRQPFIAPADVIAEVKVIRKERLDRADATFEYDGDPDDTAEYQRQLLEHRRAIGDGAEPPALPELTVSVPPKAIANTFHSMPRPVNAAPAVIEAEPWFPPSEESKARARAALAQAARDAAAGRAPAEADGAA